VDRNVGATFLRGREIGYKLYELTGKCVWMEIRIFFYFASNITFYILIHW
jgi:hypothetical protein